MNSKQKKEPPQAAHALTREVPLIGTVRIVECGGNISRLDLGPTAPFETLNNTTEQETSLLNEAFKQLGEYLTGKRRDFDLPLAPEGTDFQRGVWHTLQTIPYGQTRNYKQVAEAANCPKGYRAVGLANNRNPIAIFIPCHRVIGADGKMVGYGGGLDIKVTLLKREDCKLLQTPSGWKVATK